jgi:hypothetical protein
VGEQPGRLRDPYGLSRRLIGQRLRTCGARFLGCSSACGSRVVARMREGPHKSSPEVRPAYRVKSCRTYLAEPRRSTDGEDCRDHQGIVQAGRLPSGERHKRTQPHRAIPTVCVGR